MVDPIDPTKAGNVPPPIHGAPKLPANPMPPSNNSQANSSTQVPEWVKKLCPGATPKEQDQFYSNWIKSITAQIAQDQKFHEDQREQRKEDSGDDDGEL